MDKFKELQDASFTMLEAYKDFRDLMDSLKGDRSLPSVSPMNDMMKVMAMPGSEDAMEVEEEAEDYDSDSCEDFPGRPYFKMEDINAEDPRFYSGMEIGIPYAVAVRNSEGQSKLIPIVNGMFKESEY